MFLLLRFPYVNAVYALVVPRVGKMLEIAGQWGGGGVDPPAHPPSGRGGSTGGVFSEKKIKNFEFNFDPF